LVKVGAKEFWVRQHEERRVRHHRDIRDLLKNKVLFLCAVKMLNTVSFFVDESKKVLLLPV
jgi:hypothetical protein